MSTVGTGGATTARRIHKLLVANRGEVAVRVIRTAHELGIATVAVYSDQDLHSLAPDLADEALSLGGSLPSATYLNPDVLLEAARRSGADAIHPGYGFLSENADFAQAVTDAGVIWVGPEAGAIRALGDKISARAIATSVAVNVIPGQELSHDPDRAASEMLSFGNSVGYPILLKRADAGGGRGITRFDSADDLTRFFREAATDGSFAGSFVEKMVLHARHVETQCIRDAHGSFAVVSTRDCSVQRRNQKVVEEAPAPYLSEHLTGILEEYSRRLFEAVNYVGVGTCEFLIPPPSALSHSGDADVYFLEVNPRLQVEHTVSEEITGIDLVREQIRVAEGLPLDPIPSPRGHSFEVRITSEDPANDLMPTTGTIQSVTWPGGPGVRIDSFVRAGETISPDFDSLIAKLIVTAPTRSRALARLVRALNEFRVEGLTTSSPLVTHIVTHPDFCGPDSPWAAHTPTDAPFRVHTKWMEETGLLDHVKETLSAPSSSSSPASSPSRTNGSTPSPARPHAPAVMESFVIELDGQRMTLKVPEGMFGRAAPLQPLPGGMSPVRRQALRGRGRLRTSEGNGAGTPSLHAPIQATVVRLVADVGQEVHEGDLVLVLESMKMEKPIYAHSDGTVARIHVDAGDTVRPGDLMVTITPAHDTPQEGE